MFSISIIKGLSFFKNSLAFVDNIDFTLSLLLSLLTIGSLKNSVLALGNLSKLISNISFKSFIGVYNSTQSLVILYSSFVSPSAIHKHFFPNFSSSVFKTFISLHPPPGRTIYLSYFHSFPNKKMQL